MEIKEMVKLELEIPEEFLREETRCDYVISAEMKELWAVQLDLYAKFADVCKKNGLIQFIYGGSMLGAVRHKGYIPWDDDIDVAMPRKDYEKLCSIAPQYFKEPYFFQTEYTDIGTLRGHAQLRNSRTTAILDSEKEQHVKFNQGIFIDIFPFDFVNPDEKAFREQGKRALRCKKIAEKIAYFSESRFVRGKDIKKRLKMVMYPATNLIASKLKLEQYYYRKFEQICAECPEEIAEEASVLSFEFFEKRWRIRKEHMYDLEMVPFEFLEVPIPKEYDDILRRSYGNYMEFVKNGSYHGGITFDTDVPYTEYMRRNK